MLITTTALGDNSCFLCSPMLHTSAKRGTIIFKYSLLVFCLLVLIAGMSTK